MKHSFRFPLKQQIGEAAAPAIVEGDNILRGQLLASKRADALGAIHPHRS